MNKDKDVIIGTENESMPTDKTDTSMTTAQQTETAVGHAPGDTDPIIEVREARFRYRGGAEDSLDNASFTVAPGECVMLCGESGCGKTTITRLLNGLAPDYFVGNFSGSARVADCRTGVSPIEDYVPTVGSVFQNPKTQYFNTDTTAELAFPCENSGMEPLLISRRIDEVATDLKMSNLLNRSIFKLSGGEKQRIAFGTATMLRPPVLVLDEPTSNLDEAATCQLHDMIACMKRRGVTVVIAEHRLAWVRDLTDQYILVKEGRIVHNWTALEFQALNEQQLVDLGLRTLDLSPYHAQVAAKTESTGTAVTYDVDPGNRSKTGLADTTSTTDSHPPTKLDSNSESVPNSGSNLGHTNVSLTSKFDSLTTKTTAPTLPVLQTHNLIIGYNRKHPVRQVGDITLRSGEITALMGNNGCGKSTLAKTLCGLTKPLAGKILISGQPAARRNLNRDSFLVMQDVNYQLFSDSVRDEVLIGAQTPDECEEVLASLGLESLADRHPMSLSGGQKQRVVIASAMLSGKKFVVLDEPTSGLDRRHMERVGALLRRLADRGTCVLVITHDYEFAALNCNKAIRLD